MNTLLNKDYENAYTRKKANAESRGIGFELSQEDYIAIMKSRDVFTCGYTQRKMVMHRGFDHADYPELDRINPDAPYSRDNVIFCTKYVHGLKTKYVEMETSRKGLSHQDLCVIRSIEKALNQPEILQQRMKPYQEIYDKIDQRKKEQEDKVERKEKLTEERKEMQRQQKIKEQAKEQHDLAKAYVEMFEQFEKLGVVFEVSIKEFRDMVRITRCKISKVKFDNIWDKHLYVIDKTKPITKDNLLIVKKNVQEALDHLSQGDMIVLKTSMLNALKHV
jgi:hypothetical protein